MLYNIPAEHNALNTDKVSLFLYFRTYNPETTPDSLLEVVLETARGTDNVAAETAN